MNKDDDNSVRCSSCHSLRVAHLGPIPSSNRFAGQHIDCIISGGRLYRCEICQLYFRWPHLSVTEFKELYSQLPSVSWQDNPEHRADWQISKKWLNDNLAEGEILDVGCWNGAFLEIMGNKWQKCGIELNGAVIIEAEKKGIRILTDNIANMNKVTNKFDAVTAFDVIEHVEDPGDLLGKMAALLRRDGIIILSTGNTDAMSWRFMGSRYWYCTMPDHISFINRRWCEHAAHKHGLEIVFSKKFSHLTDKFSNFLYLREFTKNAIYRIAPQFAHSLRALGVGGIDVKNNYELREHPPGWMSAKDHIIVIFRKSSGD